MMIFEAYYCTDIARVWYVSNIQAWRSENISVVKKMNNDIDTDIHSRSQLRHNLKGSIGISLGLVLMTWVNFRPSRDKSPYIQ